MLRPLTLSNKREGLFVSCFQRRTLEDGAVHGNDCGLRCVTMTNTPTPTPTYSSHQSTARYRALLASVLVSLIVLFIVGKGPLPCRQCPLLSRRQQQHFITRQHTTAPYYSTDFHKAQSSPGYHLSSPKQSRGPSTLEEQDCCAPCRRRGRENLFPF